MNVSLRAGHTYRIYDIKTTRNKYAIALDPSSYMGCYCPAITILCNNGGDRYMKGWKYKVVIPHITYKTGYKYKKYGVLYLYRIQCTMIYRWFGMKKKQTR